MQTSKLFAHRRASLSHGIVAPLMALGLSMATITGCGTTPSPLPASSSAWPEAPLTLAWVGRGEAQVFRDGAYVRAPASDYDFTVIQRRYPTHWESVKNMHRRHPDYDGSAGARDQTLYFRVDLSRDHESGVALAITSTLGRGTGHTDAEFRTSELSLTADVSSFAPFDTYRLTQSYRYEEGRLDETVTLLKTRDGTDAPFVKIEERATLFASQKFASAPTVFH